MPPSSREFPTPGSVGVCLAGCLALMPAVGRSATFEDVTLEAGLSHASYRNASAVLPFEQASMSGGAAAVDYDGDGWTDLYFTRFDGADLLYRNKGDGTFMNVTASVFGVGHLLSVRTNGCAWADVDNDGDQDLYVTSLNSHRYHLFINDGQGGFREEAIERGAALMGEDQHYGFSASFGDFDHDGFLDLHVNEWRTSSQNPGRHVPNTRLLRNRGAAAPGYFEDVTESAGVVMDLQREGGLEGESLAFSSRFLDLDRDGWSDLLAVSDGETSRLFWNNGDGTFSDGTTAAKVGTDQFGMGMAVGDYDADGDFDWFVTSIHGGFLEGNGNRLFRYDGERVFTDVTTEAGVRVGGWGWGASFLDFDHDRHLDLMMVNGMGGGFVEADRSTLWKNTGNGAFLNVSSASGISDAEVANGMLTIDYDQDGDLDILVINNTKRPILYRNNGGNEGSWLKVRAIGSRSNRDGIGAIMRLTIDRDIPSLLRYVDGGSNFLGQNERTVHFGLGPSVEHIDELEITWPSGRVQVLRDLVPNELLEVTEPTPQVLPLRSVRILGDGSAEGVWSCPPGSPGVIEVSGDLRTWSKAVRLEAQGTALSWRDPASPGRGQRYYRGWR